MGPLQLHTRDSPAKTIRCKKKSPIWTFIRSGYKPGVAKQAGMLKPFSRISRQISTHFVSLARERQARRLACRFCTCGSFASPRPYIGHVYKTPKMGDPRMGERTGERGSYPAEHSRPMWGKSAGRAREGEWEFEDTSRAGEADVYRQDSDSYVLMTPHRSTKNEVVLTPIQVVSR